MSKKEPAVNKKLMIIIVLGANMDFFGKSGTWIIPGMLSLALFAFLLTRVDLNENVAGRAYAAYGGIYIVAGLLWLWLAEGMRPDRWDLFGAGVCLIGMAIILFGRHST